MAENSKIEWCDASWNAWRGCTRISEGCRFCYAETLSGRNPKTLGVWGPNGTRVVAAESAWKEPLKWNRLAGEGRLPDGSPNVGGHRPRVFCASLADVFEDWTGPMTDARGRRLLRGHWEECIQTCDEPLTMDYFRFELFNLIRRTPNLDWLLLTKRPQNIAPMMAEFLGAWGIDLMPNVWLGTSVENQAAADERIPHLLRAPAAVRFLSCEPLLGPVTLPLNSVVAGHPAWKGDPNAPDVAKPMLHWVIVGGESGPGARPMHPAWPRSLRDQCAAAGVSFFFKQWGEYRPDWEGAVWGDPAFVFSVQGERRRFVGPMAPDDALMQRVGKKAAGRLLDGRTWDEFPTPTEA